MCMRWWRRNTNASFQIYKMQRCRMYRCARPSLLLWIEKQSSPRHICGMRLRWMRLCHRIRIITTRRSSSTNIIPEKRRRFLASWDTGTAMAMVFWIKMGKSWRWISSSTKTHWAVRVPMQQRWRHSSCKRLGLTLRLRWWPGQIIKLLCKMVILIWLLLVFPFLRMAM